MAETSYGRPLPHNIYNALIGRLRDYTSTPGKNAPDSFIRGVVAGSPVGSLPTTPEALRMLSTLVGAAFGIPSAYDDINTTMHTVGDAATNPATYAELGRQIGANPAGAGGVALGSLIGLPGPMDDFIGKPTAASKTELKFGNSALKGAERRLASREATVQRKLVEGYEGKVSPWPLNMATDEDVRRAKLYIRYRKELGHEPDPTKLAALESSPLAEAYDRVHDPLLVGPDWAESPGDLRMWMQRLDDKALSEFLPGKHADTPAQHSQIARQILTERGWRGDIADAEHLALEGPPTDLDMRFGDEQVRVLPTGSAPLAWTREERGARMLNKAGLTDLANNALSSVPANASGWSPEGNILRFLKSSNLPADNPALVNPTGLTLGHVFFNGHMGANPTYVTEHLNALGGDAQKGTSFWHAGKRYFKADRGWSLDPEASIAKPYKPEGTGTILPHAPADMQAQIDSWLNEFGPEYASEYAQRAGGVDKDIADFWVSKPITTKILTKQASTEEIVWYNFIRKRYRPSE